MRRTTTILGGAALASLALAGAMAASAKPSPAVAVSTPAAPQTPHVETDAEQRSRLNARLKTMLRDGSGTRLAEAPRISAAPSSRRASRPSAAVQRSAAPRSTPAKAREAAPVSANVVSTIAPPAYKPGRNGVGYLARLDLTTPPIVPENPVECLTQAIYYEARNESEEGQAAVAEVVLNRTRSPQYPRKVCDVVYQRNSRTCQFTFTCDGAIGRSPINMLAWSRAERIAREVYEGRSQSLLPGTSVNYHANYVRPSWGRRLARVRQIGAHIFYGAPLDGGVTPGARERDVTPEPQGLIFVRNEALDRAYALFKGEG